MKRLIALLGLACGVLPAAAQETTLNAVVFVPKHTTFGEIFVRFIDETNKQGKGLLQINLRGGPDAIPTFEQGNALKSGVVDMVSLPPTFYTNVCPECDAQILPPLMTPQLRNTPFWTALQKYTNQKVNAQLLSAYGDGVGFHIWTSKPPVNNSLKGMRLRTTPNYTPLFTTLGVSLVQTAPGEVLTALERGVVDGYGWPAIGMFDLGWGAHTKYRIDPGFYNVIVNVLVNLDKWKSLRPDQRAFLEQKMAGWMEEENVRWVAERKAADDKKIKEAGIQIVDLGPNHRKVAYDAYWDALMKRAPEPTKELKTLSDQLR